MTAAFYFKVHEESSVSIVAGQWLDAKVGVTLVKTNVLPTNSDFICYKMY